MATVIIHNDCGVQENTSVGISIIISILHSVHCWHPFSSWVSGPKYYQFPSYIHKNSLSILNHLSNTLSVFICSEYYIVYFLFLHYILPFCMAKASYFEALICFINPTYQSSCRKPQLNSIALVYLSLKNLLPMRLVVGQIMVPHKCSHLNPWNFCI